jgi:MFS transporter, DHA3 family, multidrug efflux protein
MRSFYYLLINSLAASVTNNFVWFALTYWAYLETQSVLATSFAGGAYMLGAASSGFWFGSIVDHTKKKTAMMISSIITFGLFLAGLIWFSLVPAESLSSITSWHFWLLIFILLIGVIAGNLRTIALPTLVTIMVPEERRDKANGMVGTVTGLSFAITSVASGLALAFLGMQWVLMIATVSTVLVLVHLWSLDLPDKREHDASQKPKKIDIKGTMTAIKAVPGLFALIFFTTFNNFLGGVFMALMDAYGLSLVSVQVWGLLWGVLSFGFIFGGLFIARYGLGKKPLASLFGVNIVLWVVSTFFTIQPSIVLLSVGIFIWLCLSPFVEAIEQTIIQKVVPVERQGRVFGFAQSIEQAASPITAFLIGPIAHYIFIPFMTTGAGVKMIGSWYGVGPGRGIALVFSAAGLVGLAVTLVAMRSKAYVVLGKQYDSTT